MIELGGKKANMHLEEKPQQILDEIQSIVLQQQSEFNRIWEGMLQELANEKIFSHR
jgi:polyphosphate kinase